MPLPSSFSQHVFFASVVVAKQLGHSNTDKRCRDFWQIAKGAEAPKTASGAFRRFLGDVVYALGRGDNWTSLPAVMRAWPVTPTFQMGTVSGQLFRIFFLLVSAGGKSIVCVSEAELAAICFAIADRARIIHGYAQNSEAPQA